MFVNERLKSLSGGCQIVIGVLMLGCFMFASTATADHFHGGWMSASVDEYGLATVTAETRWDNEQLGTGHADPHTTGIVRPGIGPDIDWIRLEILDEYRNVLVSSWIGDPNNAYNPSMEIDIEGTTINEDSSDPLDYVRLQEFTLDFPALGLSPGTYIIYWTDAGWAYVNNQDPYPESPPWSLECKIIWDGTARTTPIVIDDFNRIVEKGKLWSENLNIVGAPYTGCLTQSNSCDVPQMIWSLPSSTGARVAIAEGIAVNSGQLESAIFSLWDWIGDPVDMSVSVWSDDGLGKPASELARVTIPQSSVKLWRHHGWFEDNVVDLSSFNLTAPPGGIYHVAVEAVDGIPGETGVYLISDGGNLSGSCPEGASNIYTSLYYWEEDVWENLWELSGRTRNHGMYIRGKVCLDDGPALSYHFITGQEPPRWGPLWHVPEMTVDAYGQMEIPAHVTDTLMDVNFYLEPGDYRFKALITDIVTGQYIELSSLLDVQVQPVVIDIKPGSDINSINCTHAKNTFPVAVLTTPEFDATTIDPTTVYFGLVGAEGAQEVHTSAHLEDVDADGDIDLLFHFRWYDTGLPCHQELGSLGALIGQTYDGSYVRGMDAIHTVIPLHADCDLAGTEIHDHNEILVTIGAEGKIGHDYSAAGGRVFFPRGSCDSYVYTAGPWVGGIIDAAPGGVISQSTYNSEFVPSEIGNTGERYRVFNSSLAGDKQVWPPEFCDEAGSPIIYGGGQNLVTQYNDLEGTPQPGVFAGGHLDIPLGIEVNQRSLAFIDVKKRNDIIFLWRVTNISTETIYDAYFGYFIDFDIGDPWDDRTALVEAPDGLIAVGWDSDFIEEEYEFTGPPALVGFSFLEIPEGASVNFSGVNNPDHGRSDTEQYERLNGTFVPAETPEIGDMRYVLSAGPFTLAPGEHEFVSATLFMGDAPPWEPGTFTLEVDPITYRPDPEDEILADLLLRRPQVQDYYDKNLLDEGLAKPEGLLPDHFSLAQNYPNPFNPSTEIKYSLASACQVNLEVYNVVGRKVAVLVSGLQEAGEHSIHWEAADEASGVYLYRLSTPEFTQTRKMLLLK